MTYTDMWANMHTPDNTPTTPVYENLTERESGCFDALALALAHWPEDRKCPKSPEHIHNANTYPCWHGWVAEIYAELHVKEYGE